MSLRDNIAAVQARIGAAARRCGRDPGEIALEAATKVQTSQTIREAIAAGITLCGENRVQELTAHLADNAYEGARVHFIGHLQTNKVRQVVGKVDLIESVDSLRLLEAIQAQAQKVGVVQDILLEVNIAGEEQKSGFAPAELPEAARLACRLSHVRLRGLMCIPPAAAHPGDNLDFFAKTRQLFVDIRREMGDNDRNEFVCLSMGMSGDLEDAVAAGSTQVRVGTALFGPRPPMGGR